MGADGGVRQELIFKVLGWGTVVYLLFIGFALDRHAMFELTAPPGTERMRHTQIAYADALDAKSRQLAKADPVEAANLTAQAAKIRFDVDTAVKDQSDSRFRAVGLIAGTAAFAIGYPLLILITYRRTDPDGRSSGSDLIPLKAAIAYGIGMSVITAIAGISTAVQ